MSRATVEFTLEPADNQRLANVCGQFNRHLHQIEQRLNVEIANRGNQFTITGVAEAAHATELVLQKIFNDAISEEITPEQIHLAMQEASIDELIQPAAEDQAQVFIKTKRYHHC